MKKNKLKEIILYVIFGVLTTVVNLVSLGLLKKFMDVMIANVFAWVVAVAFAYVTNKLFVFESKSWKADVIKKEIPSFTGARLLTLGIEEFGLLLMIKICHWDKPLGDFSFWCLQTLDKITAHNGEIFGFVKYSKMLDGEMMVKIILAVVVVILNYIFSKLIIFKKKES